MKKAVVVHDSKDASTTETLLARFAVGFFVVVWISSILSPLLLYQSIVAENYIAASIIVLVTLSAYAPWKKGPITRAITRFYDTYQPKCYKSSKRIFCHGAQPSKTNPMFYAVHPHGAFCLGWANLFSSPTMDTVRFCFSPVLYFSPFFKLFSRSVGKPGRADKASMKSYMKRGEHLALPPGGFEGKSSPR